jgi:hypothetical protein
MTFSWHAQAPSTPRRILLCAILCASSFSFPLGCTAWKDSVSEPMDLPAARMSPDSVALEITFIRVPVGQARIHGELWESVDEQVVPHELRQHLNNNGFRCGLVGLQMPPVLRELLERNKESARLDQAVTSEMDVLAQNQLVQRRSGERWEIVAGAPRESMIVLYRDGLESKVRGSTFADAQGIFAGRPFPKGDGTVRLELTPEIHYGPPRNQWVAGQGTFHFLPGRDREVYQQLMLNTQISPGQTLILTCTPDMKGLGHNFFVEDGRGDPQQKLLLVRLAHTQRNELFEDDAAKGSDE